jgi:copper chaperone
MIPMTSMTSMTNQIIPFDARSLLRRLRSGTTMFAVLVMLTGNALIACDDSNATATSTSDATVATYAVRIDGMHCESCVKAITAKVVKVEGVRSCTVDLEGGSATIDAVPAAMPTVRTAIAKLGFTVLDRDAAAASADGVDVESDPAPDAESPEV